MKFLGAASGRDGVFADIAIRKRGRIEDQIGNADVGSEYSRLDRLFRIRILAEVVTGDAEIIWSSRARSGSVTSMVPTL
jgi:hypothetical protein